MLLQTRDLASRALSFVIDADGRRYKQTTRFLYPGGVVHESVDLMVQIKRQVQVIRACYQRFGPEIYNMNTAQLRLKIRLLKAVAIKTPM